MVDVEHPVSLDLGVLLHFLAFYFVVAEVALDISISDYLNRSYPVLGLMVSNFEVPDEVIMGGVDCVYLAVTVDEVLGQTQTAC